VQRASRIKSRGEKIRYKILLKISAREKYSHPQNQARPKQKARGNRTKVESQHVENLNFRFFWNFKI
jgi:hypothetical protein